MILHLGFTGTQFGVTDAQRERVRAGFSRLVRPASGVTLHHGDCIEWDAQAHALAREFGFAVELHPPVVDTKRAHCVMLPGERVHAPQPYLVRNRAIVDATRALIACPKELDGEALRSGTWATVRYARRLGRPVVIVRPDGRVEREDNGGKAR